MTSRKLAAVQTVRSRLALPLDMTIPNTMKAARVVEAGAPYEIQDIPVPQITEPHQLLLKTGAAGFCHTDTMARKGEGHYSTRPITGSHEPAGTIVAVGDSAAAKGWSIGQRVVAMTNIGYCGTCPDCQSGRDNHCPAMKWVGLSTDGAFAEYVIVDCRAAARIPDSMPFTSAAPLACAGATIHSAILVANVPPGGILGIIGLGALGHIGVQLARIMGYTVVGVDSRTAPLELAKGLKLSPALLIDSTQSPEQAQDAIKRLVPGKPFPGLDAAIVATDAVPAFDFAVKILAKHGTLVMVGQPGSPVSFTYQDIIFKDITVKGSVLSTQANFRKLVELVSREGVEIYTKSYRLEHVMQMVHDQENVAMKGKFVIDFQ
ncbi:GroES-like protein [Exidia glandulosa HHB12029]|uniref:GroES-like protein n=1 Tax=Exidia glandulosa HHB12029 TaxID=1314781 RepID=A0A165C330_EXIGL|nr:GroES-like protein [Exidia glandulosa HHB12029]